MTTTSKVHDYDGWAAEWESAWDRVSHDEEWTTPWMRDFLRDGNPIFSAWSPRKRLGVRVVQSADPGFEWYIDIAGEPGAEITELVVACGLEVTALFQFEDLLRQWIRGTASIAERRQAEHEVAQHSIEAAL